MTLGGGLSAFTRAWGLACDHLREVEIVTADGRIHHSRPGDDLFWAMCGGGGGNFGAVTAFEFGTEDIRDLTFAKFIATWPATDTAAVLCGWGRWKADPATPREVCAAFEQLSDSGLPSPPTVTGTFIGTPTELDPVLDRLTAAVGHPECQRVSIPFGYVQATSKPLPKPNAGAPAPGDLASRSPPSPTSSAHPWLPRPRPTWRPLWRTCAPTPVWAARADC